MLAPRLQPTNIVEFINPEATLAEFGLQSALDLEQVFSFSPEAITRISWMATPKDIANNVSDKTVVYSAGGDTTVNMVVAAEIGSVEDDFDATAANYELHAELAQNIIYIAGSFGNANNVSESAMPGFGSNPAGLLSGPAEDIRLVYYRPLMYQILEQNGDIARSGIATSCIGLGAAALAATDMEAAKADLKLLPRAVRLVQEGRIAFSALVNAPAFSAQTTFTSRDGVQRKDYRNITGVESVGTETYAKAGKTKANIDTNRQQIVITRKAVTKLGQTAATIATFARVQRARHELAPLDFTNAEMSVLLTSDEPVPVHIDGRIGPRYYMEPGQSLRTWPSRIAVPTIMKA